MGRLGLGLGLVLVLRQGLGLVLALQLRIGIRFRRNHSWSSTFMPRRNHSLCLIFISDETIIESQSNTLATNEHNQNGDISKAVFDFDHICFMSCTISIVH